MNPRLAVVAAVAAGGLLAGCGGTAHPAASTPGTTASASVDGPFADLSSPAVTPLPSTTTAAGKALGAKVIAPPAGYELDPDPGIPNGELPPALLDQALGQTGFAQDHGYVTGWSTSFQDTGGEGLEVGVILNQLTSPAAATAYLPVYQEGDVSAERDEEPELGTIAAIPGSVTLTPVAGNQNYAETYNVLAVKGSILMDVSYSTKGLDPNGAALVARYALAQYQRL